MEVFMGPRTVLFVQLGLTFLTSMAHATPVSDFFLGNEVTRAPIFRSENSELARLVAAKIEDYGLSTKTVAAHGFTQAKYVALKAKSIFPVIYFDVKVHPDNQGALFTFDIVYSKGDDLGEERPEIEIANCQGRYLGNGSVQLSLNECIANSNAQ